MVVRNRVRELRAGAPPTPIPAPPKKADKQVDPSLGKNALAAAIPGDPSKNDHVVSGQFEINEQSRDMACMVGGDKKVCNHLAELDKKADWESAFSEGGSNPIPSRPDSLKLLGSLSKVQAQSGNARMDNCNMGNSTRHEDC
ncbi:hypothetical protein Ancab_025257 [Ancistrocladus abbreviatus]